MRKYRHQRKPYWRIVYRIDTPYYQTSQNEHSRFGAAFLEYMGSIEHMKEYLSVELQRVQPLVQGEPGWCWHQQDAHTIIARRAR